MKEQQSLIQFNKPNDSESNFEITTLKALSENLKKASYDLQKPHIAQQYGIIVITTGIGHHTIDFKKYDFTNGTFLFIAKGQTQTFDFKPGNEGYVVSFSEEFLNGKRNRSQSLSQTWLYNYHTLKPKIQVKSLEQDHFFDIIKRMYHEYQAKNAFAGKEIIQTLLNLLLLESERKKRDEFSNTSQIDYNSIFFQFKNLCEKHYAESLSISYKHLNNICKQCINKTAKQFIDDFIIIEAKRCLLSSELSVREISEHTGFDEATNFVKYFKKHTDFSPEKYRKKSRY